MSQDYRISKYGDPQQKPVYFFLILLFNYGAEQKLPEKTMYNIFKLTFV